MEDILTFVPNAEQRKLINLPFDLSFDTENMEFIRTRILHRISSYHKPHTGVDWHTYDIVPEGLELVISQIPHKGITLIDLLKYLDHNQAFPVSRDQLFNLLMFSGTDLQAHAAVYRKLLKIVAPAPIDELPNHQQGDKICPMLTVRIMTTEFRPYYRFDWSWVDRTENMDLSTFAYWRLIEK